MKVDLATVLNLVAIGVMLGLLGKYFHNGNHAALLGWFSATVALVDVIMTRVKLNKLQEKLNVKSDSN